MTTIFFLLSPDFCLVPVYATPSILYSLLGITDVNWDTKKYMPGFRNIVALTKKKKIHLNTFIANKN